MKSYCKKFLITFVIILLSFQGVMASSASAFGNDAISPGLNDTNLVKLDENSLKIVNKVQAEKTLPFEANDGIKLYDLIKLAISIKDDQDKIKEFLFLINVILNHCFDILSQQ